MLTIEQYEKDKLKRDTSEYSDILAQEVLARGFCIRIKGRGQSMYPLIQTGDMLLIEPKKAAELHIGDVILYRRPWHTYVVHRLIAKRSPATLITKGDNRIYNDSPVPAEEILGKVIQIEKNGRRITLTGKSSHLLAWIIARFACNRNRVWTRLWRHLGRLWWFFSERQTP